MSIHGKLAVAGLLVVFLAGCQVLPYSTEEQGQAEDAAKKEEPAGQASQQKEQAARAAQQKAQAARAAQQKAQAERVAQQKAQAERAAEQKAQAEREAEQKAEAEREAKQQQCLGSVTSLRQIQVRWEDAERRASASPRLALPARLGEMRKLRQELEAAPGAPCSDKVRADLATSARLTENYLQNFMVNNREYLVAEQARAVEGKADRQTAKRLLDAAKVELARLDACKGAC